MADKIKLCLFFTWDVSLKTWEEKGLFERETRFYQALSERGVDITFLSWGGEEEADLVKKLSPQIKTISIYNHIPRPKNRALRALCSLLAPFALRDKIAASDILKTNQIWGAWVGVLANFITRVPLTVRCGFELYDFSRRQDQSWLRQKFIWMLSRITYAAADRINVATAEDKAIVEKVFKQPEGKVFVHPNWIDTDLFSPQKLKQKANHILFVGRLSAQKNIPLLLNALKDTKYTLDLYGEGEEKAALAEIAKDLSVKVNFKGAAPNDQLPEVYSLYPVFVLPSHYEGNPKTLLEGMSCEAAVIGADVSGIQSVITYGQNGLLVQSEPDALLAAIKVLMEDETTRKALGKAARAHILSTHKLDKLIDKELAWLEIFRSAS